MARAGFPIDRDRRDERRAAVECLRPCADRGRRRPGATDGCGELVITVDSVCRPARAGRFGSRGRPVVFEIKPRAVPRAEVRQDVDRTVRRDGDRYVAECGQRAVASRVSLDDGAQTTIRIGSRCRGPVSSAAQPSARPYAAVMYLPWRSGARAVPLSPGSTNVDQAPSALEASHAGPASVRLWQASSPVGADRCLRGDARRRFDQQVASRTVRRLPDRSLDSWKPIWNPGAGKPQSASYHDAPFPEGQTRSCRDSGDRLDRPGRAK